MDNRIKTDGQTSLYPLFGSTQDKLHFILSPYVGVRRTAYTSFHHSYQNQNMTDGPTTFHITPHIGTHFLTPHIGIQERQTDKLPFHLTLNLARTIELWQDRRTNFFSSLILEYMQNRQKNVSFHSSYWLVGCIEDFCHSSDISAISRLRSRKELVSDIVKAGLGIKPLTFCSAGQELNHYPTASPSAHIGIQVRQTDKLPFHFTPHIEYSDLVKNSRYIVRQTVQTAFKSSCWGFRQTPKATFDPSYSGARRTQNYFHFSPYLLIL